VPSRSFAEAGLSAVRFGIAASVALLVASAVSANAAEKTLIDKGEVLVRENCSRCHAIGKEGDSPHKEAPPFRTLAKNYPIEDLAESLAGGHRLRAPRDIR
jgi:mono/diheme cytochrome c family protein